MTTARKQGTMAIYKELHGQASAELLERVRVQNHVKAAVRRVLADAPLTPPQVAEAAGISARDALWTLIALRKYGVVVEDGDEGDYPRYALTRKDPRA
jgi:gamma-glutamylcysteine synthetase